MYKKIIFLFFAASFILFLNCKKAKTGTTHGGAHMALTVTSSAFSEGDFVPVKFTCDGKDMSPALSWSGVPEGAQSLALICDDPDAPGKTWVHWLVYNMPSGINGLPEAVTSRNGIPSGSMQGMNDFRKLDYGGPCPPGGIHRYFFKLYALDIQMGLKEGASKAELLKAMEGHILAEGELMGRYKRQ